MFTHIISNQIKLLNQTKLGSQAIMGNTIGGRSKKHTKIMNIKGETRKLKTPIQAKDVTKDHPGHVLLDSESVKHFGVRAKPLDPAQYLEPKRVYFLVEPPKFPDDHYREPRRVRSGGIHMGAKERLETLMLSRRSISDLSVMNPAGSVVVDGGAVRVKMRLPRAEVERLVRESKDKADAAEKIMDLYMGRSGEESGSGSDSGSVGGSGLGSPDRLMEQVPQPRRQARREKSPLGGAANGYKKRVNFLPMKEGEAQLVLAS